MRNIVILNSLHFSYPLPILMRVSYNTLIVKQNTSDYYKYSKKRPHRLAQPPQINAFGVGTPIFEFQVVTMGGKYGAGEADDAIDEEGKDEEVINDFAFQHPIYEQHGPTRKHVEEQHAAANAAGVCQFAQQTNAKGDDSGLQQISGHDQLAAKEIVDIKLEE